MEWSLLCLVRPPQLQARTATCRATSYGAWLPRWWAALHVAAGLCGETAVMGRLVA